MAKSNTTTPSPLEIIIPIYHKTAKNAQLLIKRFLKTNKKQPLRFTFICDVDDPAFEWLGQCLSCYGDAARIIPTQSYVNESAFTNAIRKNKLIHSSRYKWYWQQFKKLLSYQISGVYDKIVLWDSDTFPVSKQYFFSGSTPICEASNSEYHIPYFITFANLTGSLILPPNSSITQYSAVFAWELDHLARTFAFGPLDSAYFPHDSSLSFNSQDVYFNRIFESLADCQASNSLFADYEYINLFRLLCRYPYVIQKSHHFRYGGWIPLPKPIVINLLNFFSFSNVSFEPYHPFEKLRLKMFSSSWI